MHQPMSPEEVYNIRRVYSLYTRLPESFFPQIELCEKIFKNHKPLYEDLIELMYRDYYKSWISDSINESSFL